MLPITLPARRGGQGGVWTHSFGFLPILFFMSGVNFPDRCDHDQWSNWNWRKGWDLNPRRFLASQVFKTSTISHSVTLPKMIGQTATIRRISRCSLTSFSEATESNRPDGFSPPCYHWHQTPARFIYLLTCYHLPESNRAALLPTRISLSSNVF